MKCSLDDLPALVALMRQYHVQTLEGKSGQKRIFLRLLPENMQKNLIPLSSAEPSQIPLLSPEMGLFHLRSGVTDGDYVTRGDIVAFVAVDLLMLPVIAPETGVLCLPPRPSPLAGYHDILGHIRVSP